MREVSFFRDIEAKHITIYWVELEETNSMHSITRRTHSREGHCCGLLTHVRVMITFMKTPHGAAQESF